MPVACYDEAMGHLQIKNVPSKLHAELRLRAELDGLSLRDYVLGLLQREVALPTVEEWLEELDRIGPIETTESAVDTIAAVRREREKELEERMP
jgi:plasmid stability protein